MPQFNLRADAPLVRLQERLEGLPRRAFEQADEIGRAQHGGHPVGGEINAVLLRDGKLQLAHRADFGRRLPASSFFPRANCFATSFVPGAPTRFRRAIARFKSKTPSESRRN